MKFPRFRKATWALIIWCAIILIWVIAGSSSANCEQQDYQGACEAGTGIGVVLILILGFFGFVFLSLIWLMSRPKNRVCPQCGSDVKKGLTACSSCGFDFTQIAAGSSSPAAPDDTPPPPPPATA